MKSFIAVFAALLICLCGPARAASIREIGVHWDNGSFALNQPDYVNTRVLAASTAESFTVPSGADGSHARFVSFSSTCDFFANFKTTATVPSTDVTDGTGSELNPLIRYLDVSTTTISVISGSTCTVTASFFM